MPSGCSLVSLWGLQPLVLAARGQCHETGRGPGTSLGLARGLEHGAQVAPAIARSVGWAGGVSTAVLMEGPPWALTQTSPPFTWAHLESCLQGGLGSVPRYLWREES